MTTASGGVIIERHYASEGIRFTHGARLVVDGCDEPAGVSDPILSDPVDYEAELAERRETHEPIEPVTSDTRNTVFGI